MPDNKESHGDSISLYSLNFSATSKDAITSTTFWPRPTPSQPRLQLTPFRWRFVRVKGMLEFGSWPT